MLAGSHRGLAIFALLAALALAACTPGKAQTDPLAVMLDRTQALDVRLRAAERAGAGDDGEYEKALRTLATRSGHPVELRRYAIDTLIERDEPAARRLLRRAVVRMDHWPTLAHVLDTAAARRWVDFTPAIVRSYARPSRAVADAERPERAALRELGPGRSVEQIAFDVFDAAAGPTPAERAAAWQLLARLTEDDAALRSRLAAATSDSAVVAAMRDGAADLGLTPPHAETVTWLVYLRARGEATWARLTAAVNRLAADQRDGLEMRHLPALVMLHDTDDPLLNKSRPELLASLDRQLQLTALHAKHVELAGHQSQHPQSLRDWTSDLSWADLVVMHLVRRAMADRAIARQWFTEADADLHDTDTEHGGLLLYDRQRGAVYARAYAPLVARHDRTFIPPPNMVTDGYLSIAHYHYHAQQHDNRGYASPGAGDLASIADRQRLNGLTLTFIDPDTLNVDFYRHGGVVVDLGEVRR